jgi:hypothetical protein
MNLLRWLLIFVCNVFPPFLGRLAAKVCNKMPAYKEEEGKFRTDVGLCALGILRQGDISGFLGWVAKYPLPDFIDCWEALLNDRAIRIFFRPSEGKWKIGACPRRSFGKANLPLILNRDW